MVTTLYTNHAPHVVYIGGRAIPPGEAREVDAALLLNTGSSPEGARSPINATDPATDGGLFTPDVDSSAGGDPPSDAPAPTQRAAKAR